MPPTRRSHRHRGLAFDGHDAASTSSARPPGGRRRGHPPRPQPLVAKSSTRHSRRCPGIAVSSYQGGHMEFFKYMKDLLGERGSPEVAIFAGAGASSCPRRLPSSSLCIAKSSPRARAFSARGHASYVVERCDRARSPAEWRAGALRGRTRSCPGTSYLEWGCARSRRPWPRRAKRSRPASACGAYVLGVTGTGDRQVEPGRRAVRRFLVTYPALRLGIVAVDPTKRRTWRRVLGDRIRMNAIYDARVQMRSSPRARPRGAVRGGGDAVLVQKAAGADLVIVETAGIGQSDSEVTRCRISAST